MQIKRLIPFAIIISIFVGISILAAPQPVILPGSSYIKSSTGVPKGPIDMDGQDLENLDDVFGDAVDSDAAPRITVVGSQPIYVVPGATNVTGANIVWAPSPGERTLEGVTRAASTGDTLTFDVYAQGVLTQTIKTEGAASPGGWDCDGAASDIICVCNLYDLLVGAGAITGVTVTRTDATCSDEKLTFTIVPGTSEYLTVTTSDDTNVDMTAGVDGVVVILTSINGFTSSGVIDTLANYSYSSTGPYEIGGNCAVGGTGDWCSSAAGSVGGTLAVTSHINGSANVRAGTSSYIYWGTNSAMTSPEDGDIRFSDAASTGFDSLQLGPPMTTDANPSDASILASNSYAQATGVNQTGGSNTLGGGIGARACTAIDKTKSASDVFTITYYGQSAAQFTEGVTFTCDGAGTNDICATNLAAAFTGASGMTATAVTNNVYVTLDADLDGMQWHLADGGADGVFCTLLQGEDGPIRIAGAGGVILPKIKAPVPVQPIACAAGTVGTTIYVNDDDDGAAAELCICAGITNDATYDWVQVKDMTTACSFF